MQTRVLVTGGAGFVGSSLVRKLLRKDCQVTVLDNMARGSRKHLPEHDQLTVVEGDITSAEDVARAMAEKPNRIVHLAALHFIPYCNQHPAETVYVNVFGTQVLLDAARQTDSVEKLVFASTAAVYAPSDERCRETDAPAPIDIYGVTKKTGEDLVELFHRETAIPSLNARIFNVIGPRETNPHLLPDILAQLPGDRTLRLGNLVPKRDYIYVDDVADGIIRMLESSATSGSFNIGTAEAYSASEVVDAISDITRWPLTIDSVPEKQRPGDRPYLCADNENLTRLGWSCRHNLRDALEHTLKYNGLI